MSDSPCLVDVAKVSAFLPPDVRVHVIAPHRLWLECPGKGVIAIDVEKRAFSIDATPIDEALPNPRYHKNGWLKKLVLDGLAALDAELRAELRATTYRSGETPKPGDVIADRRPPWNRKSSEATWLVIRAIPPNVLCTIRGLPPPWGHSETWMPVRADLPLQPFLMARFDKVREDLKGLRDATQ